MTDPKLLITAYLTGTLDQPGHQALADWIRADPKNADDFAFEALVHHSIGDRLRAHAALPIRQKPNLLLRPTAIAAALLLALLVGTVYYFTRPQPEPALALVTRSAGAIWSANNLAPDSASELQPGEHTLLSGAARLSLPGQTEAFVRAPTTFRLTPNSLEILTGQITFHRENATTPAPITIKAAGVDILPHASEFAVAVQSAELAQLKVLSGKVDCAAPNSPIRTAITGQLLHLAGSAPGPFPRPLRLAEFLLLDAATSPATSIWANRRLNLLDDPSLLFYADLTPRSSDFALTSAVHALGSADPAPLTSLSGMLPPVAPGRSPGDQALSFPARSDGLRTKLTGDFKALTLTAWVKLNPEDLSQNRHRALLMADGWGQPGLVHWQLKGPGFRLSFFDKGDGEDPRFSANADSLWDGNWHLLTTTISLNPTPDSTLPAVTHYIDGVRISQATFASANLKSLRLGDCSIGGWVPTPTDPDPDRHLNGTIAEMLVFSRALTPEEIASIHTDSRPRP